MPGTFEMGRFDLREVSEEDRSLLVEGAVFYWSIGYSRINGQVQKQSNIRFQRLIPLDDDFIDQFSNHKIVF